MPEYKKKKQMADNRSEGNKTASGLFANRRKTLAVIAGFIIVVLIIIGVTLYTTQIAPMRRTVITIDGTTIRMGYFLQRIELSGSTASSMLYVLTSEEIIKIEAPKYGIVVNPEDVDRDLRVTASGGSGDITEIEFREWYRQQLNESRISDTEFKELTRIKLLTSRLHEYLAARVPTIAPQVHIQIIQVDDPDKAVSIKERLDAGEDFATLAREVSLHESAADGGELGWFPAGVLNASLDDVAFNLDIDQVSEPIALSTNSQTDGSTEPYTMYILVKVSEKSVTREVDENSLQVLKSKVLDDWVSQQMQYHDIKYNFNSEIYAWINWQLAKRSGSNQ